jgi:FkbM family methyltransferase
MGKFVLPSQVETYWNYLQKVCPAIDPSVQTNVQQIVECTNWQKAKSHWQKPQTPEDLNNCGVLSLIQVSLSEDQEKRQLHWKTAIATFKAGAALEQYSLCSTHLALAFALVDDWQAAAKVAACIHALLSSAHERQKPGASVLIYLPAVAFESGRVDAECFRELLETADPTCQHRLLLAEICLLPRVFYDQRSIGQLYISDQLRPNQLDVHLRLGIANALYKRQESLPHLERAEQLAPQKVQIWQSLSLANTTLGDQAAAQAWKTLALAQRPAQEEPAWLWTTVPAEEFITWVPYEGLALAVEANLRSIVTATLLALGDWFEQEMQLWRRWIRPGMTVIDVGANVGVYTFSASVRLGLNGRILAVEPGKGCLACLQETIRMNALENVTVCAGAAGNTNGSVQFLIDKASELSRVVDGQTEITPNSSLEQVEVFTLDTLCEREQLSKVDFVKLDAEGYELKVLQGSTRLLNQFRPVFLYENLNGTGTNVETARYLRQNRYRLFQYKPFTEDLQKIAANTDPSGLNVIAIPEEKVKEFV